MSFLGLGTSWLPMMFAIFLAEITSKKYKKLVQTATTIPNFISWVLVYAVAYALFSVGDGFFNRLLTMAGKEQINFLADTKNMWIKMWAWGTWKGLGWSAITYLAAIAGIDKQLYEAAVVDGANRLQRIWHVTLPGLIPTFFVLFVISIGNILSSGVEQYMVFDNAFVRPNIEVLDLYVFNMGMGSGQYSYTTAIGAMKTIVAVVLMCGANWLSKIIRGSSVF
jgi:putative aldouronate transport system permease protein